MSKYNIDPHNITNFKRTEPQLQAFLMFSVAVAGKTAVVIQKKLGEFLDLADQWFGRAAAKLYGGRRPFDLLRVARDAGQITDLITTVGLGKNRLLTRAYAEMADLADSGLRLKTIPIDHLENIYGVGRKTSRFFLLHSRESQEIAVLDTHILHHLRDRGYDAPKNTPASPARYAELEKVVVRMAKRANMTTADFDLMIWKRYTKAKPLVMAA